MSRSFQAALSCFLIIAALVFVLSMNNRGDEALGVGAMEKIRALCNTAKVPSECFNEKIPGLYPAHPLSQIFALVRMLRAVEPSEEFCHVLAHKIGERVVADDPSKWIEAIPYNPPDGLCSNGFIHGVIGGRFRSDVLSNDDIQKLIPDFARACEPRPTWHPSDLDKAMCYHAMGHLYDYITNADLPHALSICEASVPENYGRVCREGVFMQIYQPLEPDDYALIEHLPLKPTAQNVRTFCELYKAHPEYQGACLRESWPLFREGIVTGKSASQFCSHQPNADEEKSCYESISAIVGRQNLNNSSSALAACAAFPRLRRATCITATARALVEEDRSNTSGALAFCRSAPMESAGICEANLAQEARFIFGSNTQSLEDNCALFSENLQNICRGG